MPKAHAASPVSRNPAPVTRTEPAAPDENTNDGSAFATTAGDRYAAATAASGTVTPPTPPVASVNDAAPDGIGGDSNETTADETMRPTAAGESTDEDTAEALALAATMNKFESSDEPNSSRCEPRLDPVIQRTPPPSLGCNDGCADRASGAGDTSTWPNGLAACTARDSAKNPPGLSVGGIRTVPNPTPRRYAEEPPDPAASICRFPFTPSSDTAPS